MIPTLYEVWQLTPLTLFVTFFATISSVIYIYGACAAIYRLKRKSPVTVVPDDCKISVLKPMSGLDPQLEENLNTFVRLEAPAEFEVILCLGSEQDGAYPIAKKFAKKYPKRFKLVVGSNPHLGNAKMAQLSIGFPHAKNDFIWISESNVETSQAFMHSLLATWKEANMNVRRPTLVHAPLVAVGGSASVGGALERMHLASHQNVGHEVSLLFGVHAVIGKTEFFHKDDLLQLGGIEAFGNFLGEDFMMGRAFQNAGVVRCSAVPTRNVIGQLRVKDWIGRHTRWAVMRKTMEPVVFHSSELFMYPAIPILMGIFGLISWQVAAVVLAIKIICDCALFWTHAGERPSVGDFLIIPFKELAFFGTWILGATTLHVKWRDKAIRLGKNSMVLTKTAEPSKLRRHWNTMKRVFVDPNQARRRAVLQTRAKKKATRRLRG
ncbi:MAG: glycosyltransferase [Deltaproteobacteria bacterium]|nr:glycosyltransferase [Deltaproteobacteria bacterium]